jgi:hypothetical protein
MPQDFVIDGDRRLPAVHSTNWPLRIYLCLASIAQAAIALAEPFSITNALFVAGETIGAGSMWVLIFLSLLGLVDAVINDLLPPRYFHRKAVEHRHILFIAISAVYTAWVFIAMLRGYRGTPLIRYGIDGACAAWIAVYHVRHRFMEPRKREDQKCARLVS